MWRELWLSVRLAWRTIAVCCVAYPLVIWGLARVAAPEAAEGSLIRNAEGEVVGSRLLGQAFSSPKYLWPRPSAAGAGYDASASCGSNLSPAGEDLRARAAEAAGVLALSPGTPIPPDLLTASGSGLDPHITLAGALVQAPRIAAARGMDLATVENLLREQTERVPGGDGELVRVLTANLALDALR